MNLRHLNRQIALQCLCFYNSREFSTEVVKDFVCKSIHPKVKNSNFAVSIFGGVVKNKNHFNELITKFAPDWPIEKLSIVDVSILQMGTYELLKTDTPVAIVINEYVELAKEFGSDSSRAFVNGVLGSINKNKDV